MPATIGFPFVPSLPPERLPSIAQAVDEYLDELWVWEDCFAESGLATAVAALAMTQRMSVGLGLMPTPLRNVAITAMEVATIARLYPGRFLPGIGHGIQEWMGRVGARPASPLTLLREYAIALRKLLDGKEVSADGRYVRLDKVALAWPPEDVPLLIGAQGPKTLEVAGECGDGVIFTWVDDDEFRTSRDAVIGARRRSDPLAEPPHIVCSLISATGPDAQERAERELQLWGRTPAPGLTATGTAEQIAEAIRRREAEGADRIVLQATSDEPDLEAFIAFLGESVMPLVRAS